jgi:hypothetical protein
LAVAGSSERLREIPYNYTSFSDREIVIRLLGAEAWAVLDELRAERVTGRSARMLYEVLGDIWVVQRNPYLEDDLLANRERRDALVEALRHRLARDRQAPPGQRPRCCLLIVAAQAAVHAFERISTTPRAAQRVRKGAGQAHPPRQHRLRRPGPRLARHRRHRLARRIPLRRALPGHRGGDRAAGARLHRTRPDHHPARRRHRLHRRRHAADACSAVINTEKLIAIGAVENVLPARPVTALRDHPHRRRRGHRARIGSGGARRPRLRGRPDLGDASCIGGNIAMNAGGKKAVLWGTALDNLAWWKMVDARRQLAGSRAPQPQLRQDPRAGDGRASASALRRDGKPRSARNPRDAGRACRKDGPGQGRHRQVPRRLPGVQKEGTDGLIVAARWVLHKMPPVTRTVCLEFFGQVREAVPAIVEITDYFKPGGAGRRRACCSPASSTSTSATCAPSATRPRPSAATAGGRRWC